MREIFQHVKSLHRDGLHNDSLPNRDDSPTSALIHTHPHPLTHRLAQVSTIYFSQPILPLSMPFCKTWACLPISRLWDRLSSIPILYVWDPHTQVNIRRLEMVKRRAARYVTNRQRNTSSFSSMLPSLHWRTLQDRIWIDSPHGRRNGEWNFTHRSVVSYVSPGQDLPGLSTTTLNA